MDQSPKINLLYIRSHGSAKKRDVVFVVIWFGGRWWGNGVVQERRVPRRQSWGSVRGRPLHRSEEAGLGPVLYRLARLRYSHLCKFPFLFSFFRFKSNLYFFCWVWFFSMLLFLISLGINPVFIFSVRCHLWRSEILLSDHRSCCNLMMLRSSLPSLFYGPHSCQKKSCSFPCLYRITTQLQSSGFKNQLNLFFTCWSFNGS